MLAKGGSAVVAAVAVVAVVAAVVVAAAAPGVTDATNVAARHGLDEQEEDLPFN